MKNALLFLTFILLPSILFSQSEGDYRAKAGFILNWGSTTSWEKYSSGSWGASPDYPNNFSTQVTVAAVTLKMVMNVDVTQNGGLLVCSKQVEVSSGKSFTYSGGTIFLPGNMIVKGTFNYSQNGGAIPIVTWQAGSTLEVSGATNSPPSLSGVNFKDVNINCASLSVPYDVTGLSFNDDLFITNTGSSYVEVDDIEWTVSNNITIQSNGILHITPDGRLTMTGTLTNNGTSSNLIIKSSAVSSGSLMFDGTITGTYELFVQEDVWHLIGIPVNKGAGANLGKFNPASGDAYMRPYSTTDSDWGAYMTSESDQLNVVQGYDYWTTVDHTASLTGNFNNGGLSFTMVTTGNSYNLISNPYPCALDWESVSDKSHVTSESIFYYNNTGGTNGYAVYNASTNSGTYGATELVPPGQGFFVEQSGGSTDMDFSNSNKAHPDHAFYKSTSEDGINNRVRLKVEEQVGGDVFWSETVIVYADHASNGYDVMVDTKMPSNSFVVAPEIYSKADSENIMINGIGSYPAVVALELDIVDAGIATVSVSELSDMQSTTEILLEDRSNDIFYTIDDDFSGISFDVVPGLVSDRFFIHYNSTVGIEEDNIEDLIIYSYKNVIYYNNDNGIYSQIQVYNIMGQMVYQGDVKDSNLQSIHLTEPTAYYVVKLIGEKESITKKLFLAN